jgi:hypothetical protein
LSFAAVVVSAVLAAFEFVGAFATAVFDAVFTGASFTQAEANIAKKMAPGRKTLRNKWLKNKLFILVVTLHRIALVHMTRINSKSRSFILVDQLGVLPLSRSG